MPPEPQQIIDRLILVTLALEAGLSQEDWPSVSGLLDERDLLVERLAGMRTSGDQIGPLRAIEGRCFALLGEKRRSLAAQWQADRAGRLLAATYADNRDGSDLGTLD